MKIDNGEAKNKLGRQREKENKTNQISLVEQ